jgi:hypothetical protein
MKRFAALLFFAFASFCAAFADAAISLQGKASFDGAIYATEWPDGNKPAGGGCPSLWTCADKGTGVGQITEVSSTSFKITATGNDDEGDIVYAYKTCGANDCEVIGEIPVSWTGHIENFTGFGVGLTDNTGDSAYYVQAWWPNVGSARCKAGIPPNEDVNVQSSNTSPLPRRLAVTFDDSANEIRCHEYNGSTWQTFASFTRDFPDGTLGYVFGTSHITTASTTATLTNIARNVTITVYTPSDPPSGAPTLLADIPNQNLSQGVAFNACFSANFSGQTSYSISGLPAGTGLSFSASTGCFSGAPDGDDVAASPYTVSICGVNGSGSTCDPSQFTVAAVPGDTFTIASSATPADYTFDCAATANCGPGDIIVLGSGVHSNRSFNFKNLVGTIGSPITIRNDTSAGSRTTIRTASGRPRYGLQCFNCENVIITGLGGWSGQPAGECGVVDSPNGTQDGGEDAVDEHLTGCGILFDGLTNGMAQDMVLLDGTKKNITIEGLEFSGDWSGPGDGAFVEGHGVSLNGKSVCLADAPNEYIENITVRKNYLHNIHDTSMYLGSNYKATCDGLEDNTLPLRDIIVEYNVWDTIGEGGAKVKRVLSSDPTDALIRYNHGRNGGGSDAPQSSGHNSILFQCHEASCTAYGNVLDTTVTDGKTGPGLSCAIQHRPVADGTQVCHFYNNTIRNTSNHGVSGSRAASGSYGTTAQIEMRVEYNTIVDAARDTGNCVNVGSAITGAGFVRDMICAGAVTSISAGSSIVQSANQQGTVAAQNFVNSGAKNFRLTSSSPARNTGGVGGCPADDADKETRPKGGTCDRGADEFTE